MSWIFYNNTVWIYNNTIHNINHFNIQPNLLCFDLDNTLITTKSGNKFPKSVNDWKFRFDKSKIINKDNNFFIFSNQSKMTTENKINEIKSKIENIINELNLQIIVFISIKNDIYRKPCIGMFQLMLKLFYNNDINLIKNMIYVGDAAGRINDFSCSDRKFLYNINWFYKTNYKFYTPEEYFNKIKTEEYNWDDINFDIYNEENNNIKIIDKQEIILFIGFPGSGKTTLYNTYFKNKGYIHINQDKLKTLQKCLSLTKKEINNKKSIIIDNTNPSIETRQKYIKIAKDNNISIRCIYFNVNEQLAKHLDKYRMLITNDINNETTTCLSDIVYNIYKKKFNMPYITEGFDEIIIYNFNINKNIIDDKYFYMKF